MNAEIPYIAKGPKWGFGQFTLRTLFIGVALVCAVLGWRQMERQYAFNGLWELASEQSAWRDWRIENKIGDAMYRLGLLKGLDPPPCLVSRIDERKRQLGIVQLHRPLEPTEQTYVLLTVLNRFGKVTSIDRVEIGSGIIGIDDVGLRMKHDGIAIITLRIRVDAEPVPEPLILIVENGKLKTEALPTELWQ